MSVHNATCASHVVKYEQLWCQQTHSSGSGHSLATDSGQKPDAESQSSTQGKLLFILILEATVKNVLCIHRAIYRNYVN